MFVDEVKSRIEAEIPVLAKRVEGAATLAELMSSGQPPNAPLSAFVLPLGFRPASQGDASANAFTQMIDDTIGVLLVIRHRGNSTGNRSLPKLETLIDQLLEKIAGWAPPDACGVFRAAGGTLVSAEAGTIIYQLDFTIQDQIRNL